jgi:predicted MFS family arabinose efflux permease
MDTGLRRARVGTALLFLLFGTALGAWTARVPAIKHAVGASDGWLSVALLGLAAGAITGQQLAGRLVDRYGSFAVLVPAALAEGVLLVPTAYAPGVAALAVALFVFGVGHGVLNIAMNANAIEVQRAYRRPIMSSFHAVYSVGGFLGAAIGGLFARAGLGPRATFLAVGAGVLVLASWALLWVLRSPAPAGEAVVKAGAGRLQGVLFLGVLAFCALVGEGAAADWSAVYLRDNLTSSAGFAAAGYAAFAAAMTVGRIFGDRLGTRLGPVLLVRASGVLAALGLGTALLVARPWAGVAGFACLGAGMSCIAPQVYSAAGARNPARAGRALARVVSMGYAGFLAGPVLIGSAATLVGLPRALAVPVLLAGFVALSATALRAPRPVGQEPSVGQPQGQLPAQLAVPESTRDPLGRLDPGAPLRE